MAHMKQGKQDSAVRVNAVCSLVSRDAVVVNWTRPERSSEWQVSQTAAVSLCPLPPFLIVFYLQAHYSGGFCPAQSVLGPYL